MVSSTNIVDRALLFPMSRKIRKSPKLTLVLFTSSLIISTTVVVNLYLFSKDCDVQSNKDATYSLYVDTSGHRVNNPPLEDYAPDVAHQIVQPMVHRQVDPVAPEPVDHLQPDLGQPGLVQPDSVHPASHVEPEVKSAVDSLADSGHSVSQKSAQVDATHDYVIDRTKGRIMFPKPISRSVIGQVIEHMKLKKGFEVGVRQGVFSKAVLRLWPTCENYHLVDLWGNPGGFLGGRIIDEKQAKNKFDALENTKPWKNKITLCHNFSTVCARRVEDGSFDFGYIDARHDFKSVLEDLMYWYPKIRVGGVMAGHDYMSALEVKPNGINWGFNADGSKDYGMQAVKGAVNLFFAVEGQYLEPCSPIPSFSSWVMYKAAPGTNQPNDLMHFIDFSCFKDSTCDVISNKLAQCVRDWEKMNPRFLALVWTKETLSWYLKEDVEKYTTSYKNNPKAFEEMMKLKILYWLGGTYIHESLSPMQGLRSFVDQVKRDSGPVAFCQSPAQSGNGKFAENCEKVSRLLISGNKGDVKILNLVQQHEREFNGAARSESEILEVTERILGVDKFRIFEPNREFPCSDSSACLAHLF